MRVLTIDVGTSWSKAAVYDDTLLRSSVVSRPSRGISSAGLVDLEAFVAGAFDLLRAARSELLPDGVCDAVAVTTIYGHVFLDHAAQPLERGWAWNYTVAIDQTAPVTAAYADARIDPGRPIGAELLAPRLLWLRENAPGIYRGIHRVFGLKDYLVYRLTGAILTDYSQSDYAVMDRRVVGPLFGDTPPWNASGAGDGKHGTDDSGPAPLPPVLPAQTVAGRVSAAAARRCGVNAGTPVILGSSDGTAAMYGAGVLGGGVLAGVTGSSDVLMTPAGQNVPATTPDHGTVPDSTLVSNRAMAGAARLVGGSTGSSGAAVAWFRGVLKESGRRWEEVAAGAEGITVAPGLSGERAPFHRGRSGAVVGLRPEHDAAALERAVHEAICFRFGVLVDQICDSVPGVDRVVLGGGNSAGDALNDQIRAAILPVPLVRCRDEQVSLRGAAIFATAALEGERSGTAGAERSVISLCRAAADAADPVEAPEALREIYKPLYRWWNATIAVLLPVTEGVTR